MTSIQRIERKHRQKRRNRLLIWVIVSLILILSLSAQASPKPEEKIINYTTLMVSADDTIWELAEDINRIYYNNEMSMRRLVAHIREVNNLNSVVIIEGQSLQVATNLSEE